MKLILILTLFFVGCAIGPGKDRIEAAKQSEATGNDRPYSPPQVVDSKPNNPVAEFGQPKTILAWGIDHPDWDKSLRDAIATAYVGASDQSLPTIKTPCKRLRADECAAQLLSIMAKYESSFKPETSYNETGHLQGVVSRGLLQISKDSANGYGCNITDAKQLHDPDTNLRCGVKILSRWVLKDRTLIGQPKLGCSRYWSVCRESSGSYKKIMRYMENF